MAPTSRTELAVLVLLVVSVAMFAVGCGGDDTATPNPHPVTGAADIHDTAGHGQPHTNQHASGGS